VIWQNMKTGEKAPETAYVLVFAPVGTTLHSMVEAIGLATETEDHKYTPSFPRAP